MKKLLILGITACVVLAFTSCKSSDSAYKKAYEKAKQQELAEPQEPIRVTEIAPVVSTPTTTVQTPPAPTTTVSNVVVREEKVTVVSGSDMKDYSIVCGSFSVKANAENLKDFLTTEGYAPTIAFNADASTYRVIVDSYSDKESAALARDSFKRRYSNRQDFQGSWLLYRLR